MSKNEKLRIKGKVEIFERKNSKWIKVFENENLVVDTGLAFMMDRLKANSPDPIDYIAVGTDDTAVTAGDTTLNTELARKACYDIDAVANILYAETIFENGEAIGVWKETGMFNDTPAGVMINRVIIDFTKTGSIAAKVKFTVTLSNV